MLHWQEFITWPLPSARSPGKCCPWQDIHFPGTAPNCGWGSMSYVNGWPALCCSHHLLLNIQCHSDSCVTVGASFRKLLGRTSSLLLMFSHSVMTCFYVSLFEFILMDPFIWENLKIPSLSRNPTSYMSETQYQPSGFLLFSLLLPISLFLAHFGEVP